MSDITERLRQYGDGLPTGLMLMRNAADEINRLRARVAELEAAKYGSNPSMVLLDEVHANGVDVDAIPISRLIAPLDVLHRRVQERDDDGAATPGDLRAALRAIFNDDAKGGA